MSSNDDARIVRAAIHPAIGIARVGNSDAYFIGPEVTDPLPEAPGFYKERDNTGALKRQAARFRIYGYDAQGNVVRELTAADAEIGWTVHVANKKSAWYQFQVALDIPEASAPGTDPSERRNASVQGGQRQQLVIDPGPRTIAGANRGGGPEHTFDTGRFFGKPVYLGELRTDPAGRLVFLGGRGDAASYDGRPAITFANNDGWHDDTADGPVTARVTLGGRELPVEGAWVVVAPPNYAPNVVGIRTLYDLLADTFINAGWLPRPRVVSFTRDIHPILERFNGLQWVNQGFATQFGWEGPNDFMRPEMLARLAAPAVSDAAKDPNAELRRQVFNAFRLPDPQDASPLPWPWIYGDAMERVGTSPRQHMAVSSTQYAALKAWAAGNFVADWNPDRIIPRTLDEVPVAGQPAMLDQAALHYCLADAFHPGCEITWPIRHTSLFRSPFRILPRPADQPEPDYGDVLTPQVALSAAGPLNAQAPGDLTRWMAVPWQTDTSSCRSGYDPTYDPYVPTFWPARVPNHVISEARYERIKRAGSDAERQAEFRTRDSWFRGLTGTYQQYINQMIAEFGKMGVVEPQPVAEPLPGMPPVMMVETGYGFGQPGQPRRIAVPALVAAPQGVELAAVAADLAQSFAFAAEASPVDADPAPAAPVSPHVAAAGWDSDDLFEQFASRVGTSARDG